MTNDTGKPVHLCLKRPQFPNAKSNVRHGHQSERHLLQIDSVETMRTKRV